MPADALPNISVIMPVYNAASTLSATIEGILGQTLARWELLAVNDGSTDDSASILGHYAAQDGRIRVIHQANGGASAARNTGIKHACGTWILFQDSDDLPHPDMLEKLLEAAEKSGAAMAAGGIQQLYPYGKTEYTSPIVHGAAQGKASVSSAVAARYIFSGPWCKLFRRSVIQQHQLLFPEGINNAEDLIFNLRYLVFVNEVALVDAPLMDYVAQSASLFSAHLKGVPRRDYCIKLMSTLASVANTIPKSWERPRRREFGKGIAYRYFSEMALIWNLYVIHQQRGRLHTICACLAASLPGLLQNATPEAVLRTFLHCLKSKRFTEMRLYLQGQIRGRNQ